MGRFDGPHFRVEGEDVVSVWAVPGPLRSVPADYFEEHYGDDDDEPFNRFSADFGFGYYDHDFMDTNGSDSGRPVAIGPLVKACSWGTSFADAVAERAEQVGCDRVSWVVLLYNFKYDPGRTGIEASQFVRFVGVFPFDKGGDRPTRF